jgi:CRISPR-associated endonuclease/helicase Cas3
VTAPFHAHSVAGRPEAEWELLRVHLREVAEEAGRLAGRLGLESVGQIAGLLHDLGKYLDAFQRRLHGGPRMDHAAAGARWAQDRLPAPWGGLIAHVVAGHHTGLRDGLLQPDGRLAQAGAAADIAARRAAGDQVELTERLDWPEGFAKFTKGAGGFQRAFLTRMVFSCLVDADRRCAARFDARQRVGAGRPR